MNDTLEKPVNTNRLGDLLVQKRQLAPHQVGVALDVQRKTKMPMGEILVQTEIVSRPRLTLALWQQKLRRLFSFNSRPKPGLYGVELVNWARARLERHLKVNAEKPAVSSQVAEAVQLRSELAGLDPKAAGRIVDKDDVIKEKLLSGNL
jgi:hypothetical protein